MGWQKRIWFRFTGIDTGTQGQRLEFCRARFGGFTIAQEWGATPEHAKTRCLAVLRDMEDALQLTLSERKGHEDKT